MNWFGNGEQTKTSGEKNPLDKKPWDDIKEPLGDLEAARTIRAICKAVTAEPPKPVGPALLRKVPVENPGDHAPRAAKAAMELAMKITDPLVRDDAVRQIIGLCIASRDVRAAQILTRAIQSESIRAEVLQEYPALRGGEGTRPRWWRSPSLLNQWLRNINDAACASSIGRLSPVSTTTVVLSPVRSVVSPVPRAAARQGTPAPSSACGRTAMRRVVQAVGVRTLEMSFVLL